MLLHFSLIINGKQNFFVAKIWRSILKGTEMKDQGLLKFLNKLSEEDRSKINRVKPKLHTIREDKPDLWKTGMDIEPVISDNSSSQLQFAPTLKCLGIQTFSIAYFNESEIEVIVDGKLLSLNEVETLAVNDGFDNAADFYRYFNHSFKGKLIHWTDLKY
jgi:hypothetical protein